MADRNDNDTTELSPVASIASASAEPPVLSWTYIRPALPLDEALLRENLEKMRWSLTRQLAPDRIGFNLDVSQLDEDEGDTAALLESLQECVMSCVNAATSRLLRWGHRMRLIEGGGSEVDRSGGDLTPIGGDLTRIEGDLTRFGGDLTVSCQARINHEAKTARCEYTLLMGEESQSGYGDQIDFGWYLARGEAEAEAEADPSSPLSGYSSSSGQSGGSGTPARRRRGRRAPLSSITHKSSSSLNSWVHSPDGPPSIPEEPEAGQNFIADELTASPVLGSGGSDWGDSGAEGTQRGD